MHGCRFHLKRLLCLLPGAPSCVSVGRAASSSSPEDVYPEPVMFLFSYIKTWKSESVFSPQGGGPWWGQPHDHSERGYCVWTHSPQARDWNGQHRGPHGVPEPDSGAHTARVRKHLWEVEAQRRKHELHLSFIPFSLAELIVVVDRAVESKCIYRSVALTGALEADYKQGVQWTECRSDAVWTSVRFHGFKYSGVFTCTGSLRPVIWTSKPSRRRLQAAAVAVEAETGNLLTSPRRRTELSLNWMCSLCFLVELFLSLLCFWIKWINIISVTLPVRLLALELESQVVSSSLAPPFKPVLINRDLNGRGQPPHVCACDWINPPVSPLCANSALCSLTCFGDVSVQLLVGELQCWLLYWRETAKSFPVLLENDKEGFWGLSDPLLLT